VTLQNIAYAVGLATPILGAAKFYWDMQQVRKQLNGVAHRGRLDAEKSELRFRRTMELLANCSEGTLRERAVAMLANE
jgi:hypothetical protein